MSRHRFIIANFIFNYQLSWGSGSFLVYSLLIFKSFAFINLLISSLCCVLICNKVVEELQKTSLCHVFAEYNQLISFHHVILWSCRHFLGLILLWGGVHDYLFLSRLRHLRLNSVSIVGLFFFFYDNSFWWRLWGGIFSVFIGIICLLFECQLIPSLLIRKEILLHYQIRKIFLLLIIRGRLRLQLLSLIIIKRL